jgi:hypothetical protein
VQQQATAEMIWFNVITITDDGGSVKVWADPKLAEKQPVHRVLWFSGKW